MKEVFLINMYTEDGNIHTQTMGKEMFDSLENSTHRIIYDNDSPVTKISKINILKGLFEQMYYEWKDEKYTKVASEEETTTKIEEESTAMTESNRKDGVIKAYLVEFENKMIEYAQFNTDFNTTLAWQFQKIKNKFKAEYMNPNREMKFKYIKYVFYDGDKAPKVITAEQIIPKMFKVSGGEVRRFRFKTIKQLPVI